MSDSVPFRDSSWGQQLTSFSQDTHEAPLVLLHRERLRKRPERTMTEMFDLVLDPRLIAR